MAGIFGAIMGGRGPVTGVSISIAPASDYSISRDPTSAGNHTATVVGGAPSSYAWAIDTNGSGQAAILAGGNTATATLQGGFGTDVFTCTAVVSGTPYKAYCSRTHERSAGGGGGGVIP